ncbi:MAG: alpha/beta fold hydrolase [Gemmatimonadota bacterium]
MIETLTRAIRGIHIFERRIGEGPPSVVLHGGPGAHHDYLLPGFDDLARDRMLIYYDQRGGGRSPVGRDVPVGWREQVEDLEALRVVWGIERLSIAGYSWGGLLGLLYATQFPQHVDRIALVSGAPAWREARAEFEVRFAARNMAPGLQEARQQLRSSGLREADPEAYRKRVFELSVAGYFFDPELTRDLTPFRVTGRTQEEVWASLGDYDLRPALQALSVPAIVLHGDSDPIPSNVARETAELLRAPFYLLANTGHVPYVEARDEFVRLLDRFLPAAGR